MKALILVGGKGTRLKPYTSSVPKPLLPVGDKAILEIILAQLKNSGVNEVVLAVGYMAHFFESFFQDGKRFGLKISYSFEEKALGTAGAIALAIDRMEDDFIVMNGDLLTTLDYKKMFKSHKEKKAAGTIAIFRREVKIDFGVVEVEANSMLKSYTEKPSLFYNFGMGVNVINRKEAKTLIKKGEYLDMPDLMLRLKDNGKPVYCYQEDCFWLDMGNHEDYEKANEIFEQRKGDFLPPTDL